MGKGLLNLVASDWKQAQWAEASRRVPALIISLTLALAFNQPAGGVVAAGACFAAGLVGKRQLAGSSFWAMVTTTWVMAFSAWIGTLVGASLWLGPLVTVLWGLAFGFLTVHDEDSGWIAMQGIITLVIAMAFPSHGYAALERSLVILLAGMLQIGILAIFEHLKVSREKAPAKLKTFPSSLGFRWGDFIHSFKLLTPWKYAVRVSLTLIVAVEVARALSIQNGYWLPMTAIIILKPDFYRTYSGAIQRVVGTFIGVSLASLIAHLFHPSTALLLVLVAIFPLAASAWSK